MDRHGASHLKIGPATISLLCEARQDDGDPVHLTLESDMPFDITAEGPTETMTAHLSADKVIELDSLGAARSNPFIARRPEGPPKYTPHA